MATINHLELLLYIDNIISKIFSIYLYIIKFNYRDKNCSLEYNELMQELFFTDSILG
jgi:hypothetical protein